MKSSGYTDAEINSMRNEAIRRVKMMQQRANLHGAQAPNEQKTNEPEKPAENPHPPKKPQLPFIGGLTGKNPISDILNSFGFEKDYILIMALIYVLISEEADIMTIMAVCYLLL